MIFPIVPQFKQRLGLMCPADEIFLGGSLGGGKTLFDILQVMKWGLENKNLNIFIFRQTFEELKKSVIQEFIDTVPSALFRYKSAERVGVLPNGSRIFFCYLENEKDLARYQSTNMEVVVIDECTHIPESFLIKIKRRNRSKRVGFRARTIYTGNPGGASHNYFYTRFMKGKQPYKIYITEETKNLAKEQQVTQCFIPAGLVDNPALLKNDPAYIGKLLEMTDTDKEMYLYGNWEINAGQFFKEWDEKKHIIDHDVILTPYDNVVIGMDFGTSKPSAIGFFKVEQDKRLTLYKEIYTMRNNEPDTGTNEPVHDVAKRLVNSLTEQERSKTKYICLDTACWQDLGHGRTIAHIIMDVLQENNINIPVIQAHKGRLAGWQQMRWYLGREVEPNVPFLRIHKSCKNFIRTIPALVHGGTEGDIDCFVAGTKVETLSGIKNIEDITTKDYMLTPVGYKKVIKDGISGVGETLEVLLSNGKKIIGTKNHKIYIQGKGLVPIQELRNNDIIVSKEENKLWKNLFTKMLNIASVKVGNIIIQGKKKNTTHYINKFGLMLMEKFLLGILYIIKTLMLITISWKTYKCFLIGSIVYCITILENKNYLKVLKFGVVLKKAKKHLNKMHIRCWKTHQEEDYRASYVEKILHKELQIKHSVLLNVKNNIIIQLQKFVKFVVKSLGLKDIQKKKLEPVRIVAVGNLEKRTVYNLTVQGIRLYYANGILVTNTRQEDHMEDLTRYICMMMPRPTDYKAKNDGKIYGVPKTYD